MDRRRLICAMAATPFMAWGGVAHAQAAGRVWHVGFLGQGSGPSESNPSRNQDAFREGLRTLGYLEGRNLLIESRWAEGKVERLPALAAELVALKVDVIVGQATSPILAAKGASSSIPIVMTGASEPIGSGLIASLARPGGNVTGMSLISTELAGKRLQLLREVLPKARTIGVLLGRRPTPGSPQVLTEELQAAAKRMGITLVIHNTLDAGELAGVLASMKRARAQALFVQLNPFSAEHRERIAELAIQHRLPTMFEGRASAEAGGFMSYGPDLLAMYRRAAYYVDRIFKGTKPADLPVEQPTKFELVVNLKTAKALGIKVPKAVLARADEVIR